MFQPPTPSPYATWPWPGAKQDTPHPGVTRWRADSPDGTSLELVQFDFRANPGLRFGLYDLDEDDERPLDNLADYYPHGVGWATRHLNERGRGRVVAAWNGLFFGYDRRVGGPHGMARHVGPVVLKGKVYHNVGNPRWSFGVRLREGSPEFKTLHQPDRQTLAREFDYASAGAQCLVLEGKPLKLHPFPRRDDPPPPQPVPSTPEEAGHIPFVDHMQTSRTSLGWTKGSESLYLLIVSEPDHELGSKLALKRGEAQAGGWTVPDLQRFWQTRGVWGAVNLDGGVVTQRTLLRPDGRYEMVPPRLVSSERGLVFSPEFKGAPAGGTLMYFFVSDAGAK